MTDEPTTDTTTDTSVQQQDEPTVEQQDSVSELAVTTTKTKDYLGRSLVNIATDARDYLGRACIAGDKDYLGRSLVT